MSQKTYRLSPSKLSEFRENPRAFWLAENHRLARPRGIFPSLPGGVDKVLKDRADIYRAEGKMLPELRSLSQYGFRLFAMQSKIDQLRMWQKAPTWTDAETGCSMIFAIDDLLVDSFDRVVPIDWKTKAGLPDEEYGRKYYGLQLDCYRLILDEAAGLPCANTGVLQFYSPNGTGEGSEFGLDMRFATKSILLDADKARAVEMFRAAVACLRGPLPPAGPTESWDKYALDYSRMVVEHAPAKAVAA
jgi:hypothetical protein